ncbi:MAG: hypothetical protein ACOC2Q_05890 [Spirochaetota bacterium]
MSEAERPEGITESEHQSIIASVDSILTSRAAQPEEIVSPERRRSGFRLVSLVNLLTLLTLGGAVYAYVEFAPRSAPEVNLFSGNAETVEAAVLSEFREQSREELSERERRIADIERELGALRRERQAAQTSDGPSEREAELQAALSNLSASTSERLNALRGSQEQINFFAEQLTTIYATVQSAIRAREFDRARGLVLDAAALIDAPALRNEPALATIARAITAANLILEEVLPLAAEESSRLALLASRLEELDLIVSQADARLDAGELEPAERLYSAALRMIDGTDRAASQLLALHEARAEEALAAQASNFRNQIAALNAQLRESRATTTGLVSRVTALESRRDELEATRDELTGRLTAADARIAEANESNEELRHEITALESEIEEIRSQTSLESRRASREIADLQRSLESMGARAASTARTARTVGEELVDELEATTLADQRSELMDLIGTRVLLRAVVNTPPISTEYPDLFDEMETYFQALSRERLAVGRTSAYRQASTSVERLAAGMGIDLAVSSASDTPAGYLERVTGLVQAALLAVR